MNACQKNPIEQAGGPPIAGALPFATYTGYPSSPITPSYPSQIFQIQNNGSNVSALTNTSSLASRSNHNSTFTGYNTLVFASDSLVGTILTTSLFQYNSTTHSLKKLTSGLYRDQNPSYSNYNNILAFTTDTARQDSPLPRGSFPPANILYLNYFSKGIFVPITHFQYGNIGHSTWSLDGSTVYFDYTDTTHISHIYSIKVDGSGLSQLTKTSYGEEYPAMSPDGKTIAIASFTDSRHLAQEICFMNPDGTNIRQITHISTSAIAHQPCWSPGGTQFFFSLYDPAKPSIPSHIFSAAIDGTNIQPLTSGNGETFPQSTYIAYP